MTVAAGASPSQTSAVFAKIGQAVPISVTLADSGAPVTHATVQAAIVSPSQTVQTITLADAGDGTYTGQFIPTSSGTYQVNVTASLSGAKPFGRSAWSLVAVSSGQGRLTNQYSTWDGFKYGMFQLIVIIALLVPYTHYVMPLMGFKSRLW